MLKPIRSILFATDLTPNCQAALEFSVGIASRFRATIYMLHVIEKLPGQMDSRMKSLLGAHQWDDMIDSHKQFARKSLLGKQHTAEVVRKAIHDFCMQEGIKDDSSDFQSREIIISDGEDIVEEILDKSVENECDLIVLGGHSHLISKSKLGNIAKSVLKRSKIPVTMVPPQES